MRSAVERAAVGSLPRISAPAAANSATAARSDQSGIERENSRFIVAASWSGRSSSTGPGATGRVPARVSAENASGWSSAATWAGESRAERVGPGEHGRAAREQHEQRRRVAEVLDPERDAVRLDRRHHASAVARTPPDVRTERAIGYIVNLQGKRRGPAAR